MTLLKYELKKIWQLKSTYIILLIFVAINILVVVNKDISSSDISKYNNYGANIGIENNNENIEKYKDEYTKNEKITVDYYRTKYNKDYKNIDDILNDNNIITVENKKEENLIQDTLIPKNIYTHLEEKPFDFKNISMEKEYEAKFSTFSITNKTMQEIFLKYGNTVQERVDEISKYKNANDLTLPGEDYSFTSETFGNLGLIALLELILFTFVISFLSQNYEYENNTYKEVYTSRKGLKIRRTKIISILISYTIGFVVIVTSLYLLWFLKYDFSSFWNSTIYSSLNTELTILGIKYFIPWFNFTFKIYLIAFLGFMFLLGLLYILFSLILGLFIKNSYGGILFSFAIISIFFIIMNKSLNNIILYIISYNPVKLLFTSSHWFMYGETNSFWKLFESKILIMYTIIFAFIYYFSSKYKRGKEIG